jgi:hypothetical protein
MAPWLTSATSKRMLRRCQWSCVHRFQQPSLLAWRNGIGSLCHGPSGFDFDKHEGLVIGQDQVDFPRAGPQTPRQNAKSLVLERQSNLILGLPPKKFSGAMFCQGG